MDYSLLFIKVDVPTQIPPKLRRMPALIFNKDKRELSLKQVDDKKMSEIFKKKARSSHLISDEAKEIFVNEFIQSQLDSENDDSLKSSKVSSKEH